MKGKYTFLGTVLFLCAGALPACSRWFSPEEQLAAAPVLTKAASEAAQRLANQGVLLARARLAVARFSDITLENLTDVQRITYLRVVQPWIEYVNKLETAGSDVEGMVAPGGTRAIEEMERFADILERDLP